MLSPRNNEGRRGTIPPPLTSAMLQELEFIMSTPYPGNPQNGYSSPMFPGSAQWSPDIFSQLNVWSPDKVAAAIQLDQANKLKLNQLIGQLANFPFSFDVPIPFTTGVKGQQVSGQFKGTPGMLLITDAATDTPQASVSIFSQTLNNILTQSNNNASGVQVDPLIVSVAAQYTAVPRFRQWQQPLLVPPTTVVNFNFTALSAGLNTTGTLSLRGMTIRTDDQATLQQLISLLGLYSYWINIPVNFTGSANEPSQTATFNGIANPIVIEGATTDLQSGTVLITSQNLQQDLMPAPVQVMSQAGNTLQSDPIVKWDPPLVVPPRGVVKFQFFQNAAAPQGASNFSLLARIIQEPAM